VKPYLAELQERSKRRVDSDPEYVFIRDRIERYKKEMADKSVSLNETERKAEQKAVTAALDDLKRARELRKAANEKVFELALTNLNAVTLPLATNKTSLAAASKDAEDEFDVDDELAAQQDTGEIDPDWEETKRIMMDYIELSGKAQGITKADTAASIGSGEGPSGTHTAQSGNNN